MSEIANLENQIRTLFRTNLNIEVPAKDMDLVQTGILDSLSLVDLLASLDHELSIKIDMDAVEIDDFRTLEKIAEYALHCRYALESRV